VNAWQVLALPVAALAIGCTGGSPPGDSARAGADALVGAWRGSVQFQTGAFAAIKDLEFMYVFNSGGTLTESSNYDAVPPVPPAYGIWRQTGPREFAAKYTFYATRPPAAVEEITQGGGWLPAGRGVLQETITLSDDGKSFTSTIHYDALDASGKATETGTVASVRATRMDF
jgi:hypothetical protein